MRRGAAAGRESRRSYRWLGTIDQSGQHATKVPRRIAGLRSRRDRNFPTFCKNCNARAGYFGSCRWSPWRGVAWAAAADTKGGRVSICADAVAVGRGSTRQPGIGSHAGYRRPIAIRSCVFQKRLGLIVRRSGTRSPSGPLSARNRARRGDTALKKSVETPIKPPPKARPMKQEVLFPPHASIRARFSNRIRG